MFLSKYFSNLTVRLWKFREAGLLNLLALASPLKAAPFNTFYLILISLFSSLILDMILFLLVGLKVNMFGLWSEFCENIVEKSA